MAPGRVEQPVSLSHGGPVPISSTKSTQNTTATNTDSISTDKGKIDLNIFPDGHKTSGQHPPLYDQVAPYSAFPKEITGPTVWHPDDYKTHPERWTHPLCPKEIKEISQAADNFINTAQPLTGINPSNFVLPDLGPYLTQTLRPALIDGKGFILFKNFPVAEWGSHKCAIAYMGLGSYLGYPVSQNGRGHILGHVKDLGEDATQIDKVRIYRTNARQFFHADDADLVGLLCIARAEEGGESDIASSHLVWNILQKERPDIAELLTQPVWYFDRKGEVSQGEDGWIRSAVFYLEPPPPAGSSANWGRVYSKYDPYFIRSLSRYSDAGLIPPLSPAQDEAARYLEDVCQRVALHMILDVGDIQFLSNEHVLHARTAYRDFGPDSGMPRRHLMRLWLSTPEDEGGWRLPYKDSTQKKRGGIQVDDTPPVARLDAD